MRSVIFNHPAAALLACALLSVASPAKAVDLFWDVAGPVADDWNEMSPANWLDPVSGTHFVPSAPLTNDSAFINNGGVSYVNVTVDNVVNLTLGQNAADSGTLEMRAGGSLEVNEALRVGQLGKGVVNGLGGSLKSKTLFIEGSTGPAGSALNLSGSAALTVTVTLNRGTIKLTGPAVNATLGSFRNIGTGTIVADITGANHSAINVTGNAQLGGVLKVQTTGVAPSIGQKWRIVDAASISSHFSTVDVSGAPPTGAGQTYIPRYDVAGGNVDLEYSHTLTLTVDPVSGEAMIGNESPASFDFDGYLIQSDKGSLDPVGWKSFEQAALAGWEKRDPSTNKDLGEVNRTNSRVLGPGNSALLGKLFTVGADRDLNFSFSLLSGDVLPGVVKFDTVSPVLKGDMNGNNAVNNLDIAPFALALTDRAAYDAAFPGIFSLGRADINLDGSFNNLDIAPFAALLTGGAATVPEPGTLTLAALALTVVGIVRRRR